MLQYTSDQDIDRIINDANKFYHERQLRLANERNPLKVDIAEREQWLKKLYYALSDNAEDLIRALHDDFHRAIQESTGYEVYKLLNDVLHAIESIHQWSRPQKLKDNSPPFLFANKYVERISRGTVLVISPFNFPLLLGMNPVTAALAAGNAVILKPSEQTPRTAMLIAKIFEEVTLPKGLLQIVQGAAQQNQRLFKSPKLDMIFYTGSPKVGSIVAQEAAKNLVPCVLELGGKSPVFFTQKLNRSHWKTAIRRIFFGKFGNAGQICVAPDYLLVHASIYDEVVDQCKEILEEMFPDFTKDTEFTHMIHDAAFDKNMQKLKASKGSLFTVVKKSEIDKLGNRAFPPSLVSNVSWDDSLMEEENFAPILPILKYDDLDEVIYQVIKNHDTPLVQYIFSDDAQEIEHIKTRVRSGDVIIGDTIIHVGLADAPFGGIGQSGYGNYGGNWAYNAFSHERTVLKQPYWIDFLLKMRYAPFTERKTKLLKLATTRKPWFDRNGNDNWSLKVYLTVGTLVALLGVAAQSFSN